MKGKKSGKYETKRITVPSRSKKKKKKRETDKLSNFDFQSSSNLDTNNYKYLATLQWIITIIYCQM